MVPEALLEILTRLEATLSKVEAGRCDAFALTGHLSRLSCWCSMRDGEFGGVPWTGEGGCNWRDRAFAFRDRITEACSRWGRTGLDAILARMRRVFAPLFEVVRLARAEVFA